MTTIERLPDTQFPRRLVFAPYGDGALPEAYDASTGVVVSRHWFVWPNAALIYSGGPFCSHNWRVI